MACILNMAWKRLFKWWWHVSTNNQHCRTNMLASFGRACNTHARTSRTIRCVVNCAFFLNSILRHLRERIMPELKELVKNQVLWYSVFSKTNDVTRNEPATQWSAHGTASMMQWQNHSPLISEVAGSIFWNDLSVNTCEVSQHSTESLGFCLGTSSVFFVFTVSTTGNSECISKQVLYSAWSPLDKISVSTCYLRCRNHYRLRSIETYSL